MQPELIVASMFESSVILNGNQTGCRGAGGTQWFESSVILNGNQTVGVEVRSMRTFESSVILNGNNGLISDKGYAILGVVRFL